MRSENNANICLLVKNTTFLQKKNRWSMGCLPLEKFNIFYKDYNYTKSLCLSAQIYKHTWSSYTAAAIPASTFVPLLNLHSVAHFPQYRVKQHPNIHL